jgi:hypothetical protein
MADAPQVANDKLRDEIALQGTSAPGPSESKTNWVKDLVFPIILLLGGSVLGIGAEEYKLHSATPILRRAEVTREEAGIGGPRRQEISTTVYPVGRPLIPSLVITAMAANPSVHIIGERFSFEPEGQKPQRRQVEIEGSPDSIRALGISDFHEPQRVTWSVKAETSSAQKGSFVTFDYRGVNELQDAHHLAWTDRLPLLGIVVGLIAYSIVATSFALYFRLRRR